MSKKAFRVGEHGENELTNNFGIGINNIYNGFTMGLSVNLYFHDL